MSIANSILVTGGAGFIGSHFIRYLFTQPAFTGRVINLDKLTYAGNPGFLADIQDFYGPGGEEVDAAGCRYCFVQGDICDRELVSKVFADYEIDTVVNFAAETHVDTSIASSESFVRTNIMGTCSLLDCAVTAWKGKGASDVRFHQVSTDEIFGTLGKTGSFNEESCYRPRNPYAATKASADHMVCAYSNTYGIPITISCSSNNYGPNQHAEKLIPTMIMRMLEGEKLPIYGNGLQVREWLFVTDHAKAIWEVVTRGKPGLAYAVGSGNEIKNIDLVQMLCCLVAEEAGISRMRLLKQLSFVPDRPGHDHRYALDSTRIRQELGWEPKMGFDPGLRETIRWYLDGYNRRK